MLLINCSGMISSMVEDICVMFMPSFYRRKGATLALLSSSPNQKVAKNIPRMCQRSTNLSQASTYRVRYDFLIRLGYV